MSQAVVVGAGPAGLMLACELGLAGVETILVERLPEPRLASPGMAINATVVELLTQRGLMPALEGDGLPWPQAHFSQLWLDPAKLREKRATTFVIPQAVFEQRLAERAVKLGVDVRRGHEVVAVAQDESGVLVGLRNGSSDTTIRCDYLAGCDGAGSAVRRLSGIPFPGSEAPFYGLVGDMDVEPDDPLLQWLGSHELSGGLFTVAPSAPGVIRVATGEFGVEPPDRDAPPTIEEFRSRMRTLTGTELTLGEPRWMDRWYDVTRIADDYRSGRVFLVGDAAHVHFPFGGQGMSTGIEDAVNLGWKLASAVHGPAPADLLGTYEDERRPIGERACLTTRAQVALLYPIRTVAPLRQVFTELIEFPDVNEYLVRIAGGLDVRYPVEDGGPLTGRRLPVIELTTPDGPVTVAELLTEGKGVLLCFPDGADAVAGWGGRVAAYTAEPVPEIPAEALLLRPDGYVAWAGDVRDASLRTALTRWFGAPDQP